MARIPGTRPDLRRAAVPALLCAAAVLLAFVPVMRFAAAQGRQGALFALVVCGTYAAGALLLAEEATRGRPVWRLWALLAVAGLGMATGVLDFFEDAPVAARWTAAVLVPGIPAAALAVWLRGVRSRPRD
jgi:hypothetical protein